VASISIPRCQVIPLCQTRWLSISRNPRGKTHADRAGARRACDLARLKELQVLDFSGSIAAEGALNELSRLQKLEGPAPWQHDDHGAGLKELANLDGLEKLSLSSLTLKGWKELRGCKSLRAVYPADAHVRDTMLTDLAPLKELQYLDISRKTGSRRCAPIYWSVADLAEAAGLWLAKGPSGLTIVNGEDTGVGRVPRSKARDQDGLTSPALGCHLRLHLVVARICLAPHP
jgi:hypothetical protein